MDLHREALVIDGHTDVPTRLWEEPADLSRRLTDRHIDLPRLREGGVDALVFALYVPAPLDPERGWEHARELYRLSTEALIPGELVQVASAKDLETAARRGEVARGGLVGVPSPRAPGPPPGGGGGPVSFALKTAPPLGVAGPLDECAGRGARSVPPPPGPPQEGGDAPTDEPRHKGLSGEGE